MAKSAMVDEMKNSHRSAALWSFRIFIIFPVARNLLTGRFYCKFIGAIKGSIPYLHRDDLLGSSERQPTSAKNECYPLSGG
jgi:hypothetical protein